MSNATSDFPRLARVRTGADYRRVFEGARRCSDALFSLHWLQTDAPARMGLAVSRKVDKRAVGRNRIKRQLREQFRHLRAQLPAGDYVFVARPAASSASTEQLRASFARLLGKAGALPASAADVTMPRILNSPPTSTTPEANAG